MNIDIVDDMILLDCAIVHEKRTTEIRILARRVQGNKKKQRF